MEINTVKLDELYMKWCGEHHTTNSNKPVHDSAECTDFAEFVLRYAMSEGENDSTSENSLHKHVVSNNEAESEVAVNCGTCIHPKISYSSAPCVLCGNYSKWQAIN